MTPTRPPWRRTLSACAIATCLTSPWYAPTPAHAAPASCASTRSDTDSAQRYGATAGAEVLRIHHLDPRPAARASTTAVSDVGLGDTRSTMVAASATSTSATRILDGRPAGSSGVSEAAQHLWRKAGSTSPATTRVERPARTVGPLDIGAGTLTSQARWEPAMACAGVTGEVSRAQALVTQAAIATGRSGRALVRVPEPMLSRSTTSLERRGPAVYMVARAGIAAGAIELLGGAVRVTVVRSPTLAASISASGTAEVRYLPALLEVTGAGFPAIELTTPGDEAEIDLRGGPGKPGVSGYRLRRFWAGLPADAAGVTTDVGFARPDLPGVPVIESGAGPDGDPGGGPDPVLRISLGDVAQSVRGHAVTARVTALRFEITTGCPAGQGCTQGSTVLDLDVGVLDATAVAPESAPLDSRETLQQGKEQESANGAAADGAAAGLVGESANALPMTGTRIDVTAVAGVVLLTGGLFFLVFGLRRRPGGRVRAGRRLHLRIRRRTPDPA